MLACFIKQTEHIVETSFISPDKQRLQSCVTPSKQSWTIWKRTAEFVAFCLLHYSSFVVLVDWVRPSQWPRMSADIHSQMSHRSMRALAASKISITSKMVKTWWFPSQCLQTVIKCSPSLEVLYKYTNKHDEIGLVRINAECQFSWRLCVCSNWPI